jgi:hypothetical protein
MYNPEDLEGMSKLLDGDSEHIKHLQEGDVTVVFADATGDYNGAFTDVLRAYQTDGRRTILFEVSRPTDFYRRMSMLKQLGIKPSTIVMAAHGSPGATSFGLPDRGFNLTTNKHVAEMTSSNDAFILDEARLDRIASDEFMQPSRGIDDPADKIGRRSFIFNSCSSDVKFMGALPSTIETITRAINRPDVDTYGASDVNYSVPLPDAVGFNSKKRTLFRRKEKFVPNGRKVTVAEKPTISTRLRKLDHSKLYRNGHDTSLDIKNGNLIIKRSKFAKIQVRKNKAEVA